MPEAAPPLDPPSAGDDQSLIRVDPPPDPPTKDDNQCHMEIDPPPDLPPTKDQSLMEVDPPLDPSFAKDEIQSPMETDSPPVPSMFVGLSKAIVTTAPQINEVSNTRRIGRRRENRLKRPENTKAREALEGLSKAEHVISTAQDINAIDIAHKFHQGSREVLKDFEGSKARQKDLHNQRLRTKRAWARLAAVERKQIQDHAHQQDEPSLSGTGKVYHGRNMCIIDKTLQFQEAKPFCFHPSSDDRRRWILHKLPVLPRRFFSWGQV